MIEYDEAELGSSLFVSGLFHFFSLISLLSSPRVSLVMFVWFFNLIISLYASLSRYETLLWIKSGFYGF